VLVKPFYTRLTQMKICQKNKYEATDSDSESSSHNGPTSWYAALYNAKDLTDEQVYFWVSGYTESVHEMFQAFEEIGRKPTSEMKEIVRSDKYWRSYRRTRQGKQCSCQKETARERAMVRVLAKYARKKKNQLLKDAVERLQDVESVRFILENARLKSIDDHILGYAKFTPGLEDISQLLENAKQPACT